MLSFFKAGLAFTIMAVAVLPLAGFLRATAHGPQPRPATYATQKLRLRPDFDIARQLAQPLKLVAASRPQPVRLAAQPAPRPPIPVLAAPVRPAPALVRQAPPPARTAPPPAPRLVVGSYQQALINADRASAGLAPLSWDGCLAAIAYQSAARMAAQRYISHAGAVYQAFGCGLGSAQTGENVGFWSAGVNDAQLNSMFMASAEHRANILGPYRYVGTAWAVARNGYAYISVVFA